MKRFRLLMAILGLALVACGGPEERAAAPGALGAGGVAPSQEGGATAAGDRLAALQRRATELDRELNRLRVQHDEELGELGKATRGLADDIATLRRSTERAEDAAIAPAVAPPAAESPAVEQPVEPAAAPAPVAARERGQPLNPLLGIIYGIIIFAAIFFIVKLSMGRFAEADGEDTVFTTPDGSIHIAPSAQGAAPEAIAAAAEEPETPEPADLKLKLPDADEGPGGEPRP